jgi:hypothetical protein
MEEMDLGWRGCFNWLKRNSRTWRRRFLVAQQFYQLERSIMYLLAADLSTEQQQQLLLLPARALQPGTYRTGGSSASESSLGA